MALGLVTAGCSSSTSAPASDAPIAGDPDGDFGDEMRSRSDADVKAEIEAAGQGAIFVSESEFAFSYVSAPLPPNARSITEALVREKLASFVDADEDADKPLASLNAMSKTWSKWKSDFVSCGADSYPGPDECAKVQNLNAALERNLRGIKVMYFGEQGSRGNVTGVGVSVFVVGRTPAGSLAGVRTVAIWT